MQRPFLLPALLCFSALSSACGQAPEDLELGSVDQAIVNGVASDASHDTAVFVLSAPAGMEASSCTGTLIAPNLVATALHCITRSSITSFTCKPDGSLTTDSLETGRMGVLAQPEEIKIRVGADLTGAQTAAYGAQLFGTNSTQICRGDIGFVVLDRDLDLPITPVRLDYGLTAGDKIDIIGYGATEGTGEGRRYRSGLTVIEVGPASEDVASVSAAPRTFVVGEGPCHGDSGGPALAEDTGALVGVYSLNSGTSCAGIGVRNVYTSLNMFATLARQAFTAAGHEPIIDEAPAAVDTPEFVPENGCSIGRSPHPGAGLGSALALAALGLGLAFRRRRRRA